jgi:hypothetical protein
MTLIPPTHNSRSLQILKTVLYVLAGLILALGLIFSLSLMTSAGNMVANLVMPLQIIGGEVVSNLIAPMLTGFLVNLGIVILVISLILSALLYSIGRLIGHIALLEARVARLEGK